MEAGYSEIMAFKAEVFKGLNNRLDQTRLGLEWQLQADNVLCDDAGYLVRRPGIESFKASGYLDVHGTRDGRLLAIDTSNNLVELNESGESTTLHTGITGGPFVWCELGYALFLMSATAKWAIYPDRKITWGSLCPPLPTYTGADLTANSTAAMDIIGDPISYPPPYGDVVGTRRTQIAIGVWESEKDRSIVYFSRPEHPHEFRLLSDFQMFAGRKLRKQYRRGCGTLSAWSGKASCRCIGGATRKRELVGLINRGWTEMKSITAKLQSEQQYSWGEK